MMKSEAVSKGLEGKHAGPGLNDKGFIIVELMARSNQSRVQLEAMSIIQYFTS